MKHKQFQIPARHRAFAVAIPDFVCCVCLTLLSREELLAFGGEFACEGCVRDYYRNYTAEDIDLKVRQCRCEAVYLLRHLPSCAPRGGGL